MSAVIAVMLMVSVAVAMGAVGYAYLTGMIGSGPGEDPAIVDFIEDDENNMLTITYMDQPMDWGHLQIMGTVDGTTTVLNNAHSHASDEEINVGQKITINGNGLEGTVVVTISHLPSDTFVGEFTFEDVVL